MSKLVLLLSLLGIAILFTLGLTDPNNPVVWLASTSVDFAVLRMAMMIALAALLVTHPPRNIYLRMIVGVFAFSIAGWSLWATYSNAILLLDSLSILQFSISTGLIVLESEHFPVESQEDRVKAARKSRELMANA